VEEKPAKAEQVSEECAFDSGYEGHFRRQARIGLKLTPAQRLRWLEETMEEMRRLLGRAWNRRSSTDFPFPPRRE